MRSLGSTYASTAVKAVTETFISILCITPSRPITRPRASVMYLHVSSNSAHSRLFGSCS